MAKSNLWSIGGCKIVTKSHQLFTDYREHTVTKESKLEFIEILDKDYKQNTVYRPWPAEREILSLGGPVERRFEVVFANTRVADLSSAQQAPKTPRVATN